MKWITEEGMESEDDIMRRTRSYDKRDVKKMDKEVHFFDKKNTKDDRVSHEKSVSRDDSENKGKLMTEIPFGQQYSMKSDGRQFDNDSSIKLKNLTVEEEKRGPRMWNERIDENER